MTVEKSEKQLKDMELKDEEALEGAIIQKLGTMLVKMEG